MLMADGIENRELQCILGAARLKRLFFYLGFAFLFTWIIFGSYQDNDSSQASSVARTLGYRQNGFTSLKSRRLLGTLEVVPLVEEFDPDDTNTYEDIECSSIHSYNKSLHCEFVKKVPSCAGDDGFILYFEFVYCTVQSSLIPLAMIVLAFWLLYLFLFLGTTAESFFCRELAYITKLLKLSQNIGVTLLAVGNGAPDIFSTIAAFNHPNQKKSSLAFGALLGVGMFVTNLVVGLVCLCRPFQLTKRPFLRDNIFFLFAVYWVMTLLWQNEMTLWHAIGMLVYYVGYVLVVVLGSLTYQRWKKWKASRNGDVQTPSIAISKKGVHDDDSEAHEYVVESCIDEDQPASPKKVHAKQTDTGTLPVIVVSKNTEGSDDDSDSSRPMTPSERSAKKASEKVYSVSDQGAMPQRRLKKTDRESGGEFNEETIREETPRPRSRLEQIVDNAVYIAEDIIAAGNPNLAKVWSIEYEREMKLERQPPPSSRSNTPHVSTTPAPRTNDRDIYLESSSVKIRETNIHFSKSGKSAPPPHEETPLLRSDSLHINASQLPLPHPLRRLVTALFPFISNDFKSSTWPRKIFQIIKYPLTLILTLTIPVLDISEPLNNWNKWLTVIQCMTAPTFFSIGAEFGLIRLGGVFPVFVLVFLVSIILAVVVALTSSSDKAPFYHCVFAWVGFAMSVIWIYLIAEEIVNLLQVFGVVVKLSDGILGITLLAWGNSIQDTVTNVTMAVQGYPKMAVGACFGGPLLNILIGIGLASIIRLANADNHNEFELYFTQVTMLAAFFLILSLSLSLMVTSCLQFRMFRLYGVFLFSFYICFLVVVVLAELKVFNITIAGVLSDID